MTAAAQARHDMRAQVGVLAILAVCACVAGGTLMTKHLLDDVPALPLVFLQLAASCMGVWTAAAVTRRLPTCAKRRGWPFQACCNPGWHTYWRLPGYTWCPSASRACCSPSKPRFGDRVCRTDAARAQHAGFATHAKPIFPDLVITPANTDEVVAAVNLCAAAGVPIIAHGAGTSLEGHLSAVHGGVSLDLQRLDRIIAIDADDFTCRVEAGVTREQLNASCAAPGCSFRSIPVPMLR